MRFNIINMNKYKDRINLMGMFIFSFSFFLNHQKYFYGVNISVSDFLIFPIVFYLLFNNMMLLPDKPVLFFIFLSFITISTAIFISPYRFNYTFNFYQVSNNYTKLLSSMLYFLIGYNLYSTSYLDSIYKGYFTGIIFVGFIGILNVFFNLELINSTFVFDGARYVGLLNDPNYLSVVLASGLVFVNKYAKSKLIRLLFYILIFLSISITGSKTGMFIFIIYFVLEYAIISVFKISNRELTYKDFLLLLILISLIPLFINISAYLFKKISEIFPLFSRVRFMFTDFSSSISEGGSGRESAWSSSLDIIVRSPFLGTGVGAYLMVKERLHGGGGLSHNTYLQMISEWGVPMASLFFYSLFRSIIVNFRNSFYDKEKQFLLFKLMFVFLIGSISLSLNNARMFWFYFGCMYKDNHVYFKRSQSE